MLRAYEELGTFTAHDQGSGIEIAEYRQKLKEGMNEDEEYITFLRTQPLRRTVAVSPGLMPGLGCGKLLWLTPAVY